MKKKISGAEKFDQFYEEYWKERWEPLKKALLKDRVKVYRKNKWSLYKAISDEVIEGCYQNEQIKVGLKNIKNFYFLDVASVIAARNLPVKEGMKVLDMCAAPGGKSLVLAEKMNGQGELVLNELSRTRRDRLKRVIDEYIPEEHKSFIDVRKYDGNNYGIHLKDEFDAVLLDAPCSGEEHLLHSPSELDKWYVKRTKRLSQNQYSLLCSALLTVKSGGHILYSTCSISPLENDEVIRKLLTKKEGAVEIQPIEQTYDMGESTEFGHMFLPDRCEAGPIYMCLMKKK